MPAALKSVMRLRAAFPAHRERPKRLMDESCRDVPDGIAGYGSDGFADCVGADSDFFFGRDNKIVEVLKALEVAPNQLPILLGNSGVGKSSLAQAGVLAALKRQAWPERATWAAGPWPSMTAAAGASY
jgi:ATP-dependent Clp protease ATP-binding subunit ClpA